MIHTLRHEFKDKDIRFFIECDPALTLYSYPEVFALILSNLIMNSLNHGFKDRDNGAIHFSAVEDDSSIHDEEICLGSGIF